MPYKNPGEAAAYSLTYSKEPKFKEKAKIYRQRPGVKKRNRLYGKEYRNANLEKARAYNKSWRETYPDKWRAHWLMKKYGLAIEDFYSMLADQGGVCAICESSDWGSFGPMVDHDHTTNIIRGILCSRCNLALGQIKDGVLISRAITKYLEKNDEEVKQSGYKKATT